MLKILVVKRDKLGDLLLTTPLIELLARQLPDAQIDVWATGFTTFLVEGHPCVNRVWPIQKEISLGFSGIKQVLAMLVQLQKIRAQHYDWVISASGEPSPRSVRRARWAGGARLVAYVSGLGTNMTLSGVTHGLASLPAGIHESIRLAKLAEPIARRSLNPQEVPPPSLHLSPRINERGLQYMRRMGLHPGRFVVLGLGARKGKRQPTVRQVLSWARYLGDRGYQCVLSYTPGQSIDPGYPSDEHLAREILSENPEITPLCGPIQEAVAVTYQAAFSVIPDSGLMHIAAASPGGVIGLFADPGHSPSPDQWGPRGERCEVIVAPQRISDLPDQIFFEKFEKFIDWDRVV